MISVKRTDLLIKPDRSRVLFRPFAPSGGDLRAMKIVARVMILTEDEVNLLFEQVMTEFRDRHQKWRSFFQTRFEQVRHLALTDAVLSENRQLLIGAYFTQEYSLESAALFNPSLIWHPDQSGVPEGAKRFIISLRATGEGHISSITFRSGLIDAHNTITLDPTTQYVSSPDLFPNTSYDRSLFEQKLYELGLTNDFSRVVLGALDEQFTMDDLKDCLLVMERQNRARFRDHERTVQGILTLAQSNYEVAYTPDQHLSERIIFPHSPSEANGIEDARFVEFHEDDGRRIFYATYTAYNGKVILPQMLATEDFLHFKMSTLNGPEAQNKGLALFPRRIQGHYAMLSRQDNENMFIMFSDMLHFWHNKELIAKPTFPWEIVQLGNCGSPIETEAGWLVLMHGVGSMRKYAIGAFLLDLHEPWRVIGRLREPLISPDANEREGYVPNVVYSCGGQIHNGELIIPYALSDYASSFATIPVAEVLGAME